MTKGTFARSANHLRLKPSSQIEVGIESFDARHPNAARGSNQWNHEISKAVEASQDHSPYAGFCNRVALCGLRIAGPGNSKPASK